jgi:hypothetical protein
MALVILTYILIPTKSERCRVEIPREILNSFHDLAVLGKIIERRMAENDIITAREFAVKLKSFGDDSVIIRFCSDL